MGSRYGGLKQLDNARPPRTNHHGLLDLRCHPRWFSATVVFRHPPHLSSQEFREKIISKYEHKIPVEVVFQDLDKLPEGFTVPEGREKPWGTNHAVMMAAEVINEPFAVINARRLLWPPWLRSSG